MNGFTNFGKQIDMTESCTHTENMELLLHPGIGDISWVLSKLSTTGKKFDLVIAEDSKTRRSMPLVDMVDCINSARYGGYEIYAILAKTTNAFFSEYEKAHEDGKTLCMTANNWLEKGNRLEGYLPDINTDFHYELKTTQEDDAWADLVLDKNYKSIGIYTSSKGGIKNWNGWSALEWMEFILKVREKYPDTKFYLFGAGWDQDMRLPMLQILNHYCVDYVDLIGKTTLSKVVSVLKKINYFVGYASGLTILANVVYTPVAMLYPRYLNSLTYSWPCPISMADGSYMGLIWERPIEIFNKIKHQLDKALK